jgi:hypothetical protein
MGGSEIRPYLCLFGLTEDTGTSKLLEQVMESQVLANAG